MCRVHAMVGIVLCKLGPLVRTLDARGERAVAVSPVDDTLEVISVAGVDEDGFVPSQLCSGNSTGGLPRGWAM